MALCNRTCSFVGGGDIGFHLAFCLQCMGGWAVCLHLTPSLPADIPFPIHMMVFAVHSFSAAFPSWPASQLSSGTALSHSLFLLRPSHLQATHTIHFWHSWVSPPRTLPVFLRRRHSHPPDRVSLLAVPLTCAGTLAPRNRQNVIIHPIHSAQLLLPALSTPACPSPPCPSCLYLILPFPMPLPFPIIYSAMYALLPSVFLYTSIW